MKRIYFFLVSLFLFSTLFFSFYWFTQKGHKSRLFKPLCEKKMVVIIPSYKNEAWYKKNLDSVFTQNYSNFRLIYINDCSPDNTYPLVKEYIEKNDSDGRAMLINNPVRCGALANLYNAIHSCDDDEIVVTLDGDDWLSNSNVLRRLNQEYADPDVLMTYGSYSLSRTGEMGLCSEFPAFIRWANLFRSYKWVASHLRTFYAGLFKQIKKEDLQDDGAFFSVSWDMAFMFPMLEMSGNRAHFIPDVLYIYNNENPINDGKVALDKMIYYERLIRHLKRYQLRDVSFQ